MSEVPGQPILRIGDAERDAAVERLQQALGEGRLTPSEFDERVGIALQARTQHDLDPLFRDLPPVEENPQALASTGPSGASTRADAAQPAVPDSPPANAARRWALALQGAMWPLVLLVEFATDWHWWWLMFIPLVLGPLLFSSARSRAGHDRRELRHDLRDQRREFRDGRRELRDRRRDQR